MEIRTTDGRHVNTLPRSYGNGGPTVRNPATLLPADWPAAQMRAAYAGYQAELRALALG